VHYPSLGCKLSPLSDDGERLADAPFRAKIRAWWADVRNKREIFVKKANDLVCLQ
jgi:hypothetical protein